MKKILLVLMASALFLSILHVNVSAARWNEKIYNRSGFPAYDLVIVLRGAKTVGTPMMGPFGNFRSWLGTYRNQPVTYCRWWNPIGPIPPGGSVHIGLSSAQCCAERIKDAWWTDINGNRILGSVVWKASKNHTYCHLQGQSVIYWKNEVESEPDAPLREVTLTDIRYEVFDYEIPLEDLNEFWAYNDSLKLMHPGPIVLQPDSVYQMEIPEPVENGQWIVVRFENLAPDVGDSPGTEVTDWMEYQAEVAVWGYYVNKEIYNLGPDAWDLKALVEPAVGITDHYDNGFYKFSQTAFGPHTELRWWESEDSVGTNDQTQIGWIADDRHKIIDMWWTDELGDRITASVIYSVTAESDLEGSDFHVRLINTTAPTDPGIPQAPIEVSDIKYTVLDGKSGGLLPKDLNSENFILVGRMLPIPIPPEVIAPSDTFRFMIPVPVNLGDIVILCYNNTASPGPPMPDTWAKDFIQFWTVGTGIGEELDTETPATFMLSHGYRYPSSPVATIRYSLPEPAHVNLAVYSILGKKVATLLDRDHDAGHHQVDWNTGTVASGIYVIRMEADGRISKTKIAVLK
jgi:hypothetical protein